MGVKIMTRTGAAVQGRQLSIAQVMNRCKTTLFLGRVERPFSPTAHNHWQKANSVDTLDERAKDPLLRQMVMQASETISFPDTLYPQ